MAPDGLLLSSHFHGYKYFTDIMNRKARLAWELYLKMETSGESFSLLQLVANDCYKVIVLTISLMKLPTLLDFTIKV